MRFRRRSGERTRIHERAGRPTRGFDSKIWDAWQDGYGAGLGEAREAITEVDRLRTQCRLIQARILSMFRDPERYREFRKLALARGLL